MRNKEPYQKVSLWFLIILGPYLLFIVFFLTSIFSSYSSDFKQWCLILSGILYGGLFFIIILREKSKVPSISKATDKRALFEGAKHMFINHNEPSVAIIYEGGERRKMRLVSSLRRRKFKAEIRELWRVWKEGIAEKDKITQFEYPEYYRKRDIKAGWENVIVMACFGVLFSILCLHAIFSPQEEINKTGYSGSLGLAIVFGIFVFASAWGIFYAFKCRKSELFRIIVNTEKIEVEYENGNTKTFRQDDIKKCSCHPFFRSGMVVKFKDGTCLEHLERVSYWPVLQDRLFGQQKTYL